MVWGVSGGVMMRRTPSQDLALEANSQAPPATMEPTMAHERKDQTQHQDRGQTAYPLTFGIWDICVQIYTRTHTPKYTYTHIYIYTHVQIWDFLGVCGTRTYPKGEFWGNIVY